MDVIAMGLTLSTPEITSHQQIIGNFTTTIPRTLHPTETNHVIVCLSLAPPHLNCVFNSRHGMTWAKDAQMQPIPKRVFQLRCGHVELTI
jgi:hypothetical protein